MDAPLGRLADYQIDGALKLALADKQLIHRATRAQKLADLVSAEYHALRRLAVDLARRERTAASLRTSFFIIAVFSFVALIHPVNTTFPAGLPPRRHMPSLHFCARFCRHAARRFGKNRHIHILLYHKRRGLYILFLIFHRQIALFVCRKFCMM